MTAASETQDMDLIPPAVRRKIEEMSKFTSPNPDAATDEVTPPAGTPAEPEPAPAPSAPEPEAPKPETPPAPPAEPKSFEEIASEEMTKEQRYKIMEGMQKAIGRDLRQARAEANALRGEVEALKEQISSRPAAPAVTAAPTPSPSSATDEDFETLKEELGEKNLPAMVKYLRSQGFVVSQDLQQVQAQVGRVSDTVAASANDRFETQMRDFTGGRWKEINLDPRFKAYLADPEGRSGLSRHEIAERYLAEQNAPMLAQFFVDFEAEVCAAPARVLPTPGAKLDKKNLAAPKATPAAAAPLTDEKPMVKTSEFAKLEADLRAGKYHSDDPVKQKELEGKFQAEQARLNEAQRTGRVVRG